MEQITGYLERRGYRRAVVNGQHIEVLLREKDEDAYGVVVIDCNYFKDMTVTEYENMLRGIRSSLYRYNFKEVHLLSVLCTEKPAMVKEWIAGFGEHWVVDTKERHLLVYENQIASFLDAREIIEDALKYQDPEMVEEVEKQRTQRKIIKENWVTFGIVLWNVLVFVLLSLKGDTEDAAYLDKMGALSPSHVGEGIWQYRILTCMFMHAGIAHLMDNMFMLCIMGFYLEKHMSKWRYLTIYLGAGMMGSIASLYYYIYTNNIDVVCVGASGAIFGLTGALLWVVLRNHGQLDGLTWGRVVFLILLNVYLGLADANIGDAAHIGGLISGFILAVLFYRGTDKEDVAS